MAGGIKGYSASFKFNLVNFDWPRWHDYANANWQRVDAILQAYVMSGGVSTDWANSTIYSVGDRVIDVSSYEVFVCQVAHTTPASGTFAADRIAHPTYWQVYGYMPVNKGNWATSTVYEAGNFVVYNTKLAFCKARHTSTTYTADEALGYWHVLVDAAAMLGTVQPLDATLTGIAATNPAADQLIYANGANTFTTAALTAIGRSIIASTTDVLARSAINAQASSTLLTAIAALSPSADNMMYFTGASTVATTALNAFVRNNILNCATQQNVRDAILAFGVGGGTFSGNVFISKVNPYFGLNKLATGQCNIIQGLTNGVLRWEIRPGNTTAESANAGSDFTIERYDDAGTHLDTSMAISRLTGNVYFKHSIYTNETKAGGIVEASIINNSSAASSVARVNLATSTAFSYLLASVNETGSGYSDVVIGSGSGCRNFTISNAYATGAFWFSIGGSNKMSIASNGNVTATSFTGTHLGDGLDLSRPAHDLVIEDQKTNGTAGGTATAASNNTRTLNTVAYDSGRITGYSLASNKLTLPAGTYHIRGRAPTANMNGNRLRLMDDPAGSVLKNGPSNYTPSGNQNEATVEHILTLASSGTVCLVQYCTAAGSLGLAASTGDTEVYSQLYVSKLS